jgi:hypothetical protein
MGLVHHFHHFDHARARAWGAPTQRAAPADRPAPAAGAALRRPTAVANFFFADSGSGRTMELGRSGRAIMRPPRGASYGVRFAGAPPSTPTPTPTS